MSLCSKCNEYHFSFQTGEHVCPPLWNVWIEGEEEGLDINASREVYAKDAEDAAIRFGEVMAYSDSPYAYTVYVRQAGDERQQADCYVLDYYMQPVFSAKLKPVVRHAE